MSFFELKLINSAFYKVMNVALSRYVISTRHLNKETIFS